MLIFGIGISAYLNHTWYQHR